MKKIMLAILLGLFISGQVHAQETVSKHSYTAGILTPIPAVDPNATKTITMYDVQYDITGLSPEQVTARIKEIVKEHWKQVDTQFEIDCAKSVQCTAFQAKQKRRAVFNAIFTVEAAREYGTSIQVDSLVRKVKTSIDRQGGL